MWIILAILVGALLVAAVAVELANPPSERNARLADRLYLAAIILALLIIPLESL